jgi:anti-anti-sigma factor
MALEVALTVSTAAEIVLHGELDARTAAQLQAELERIAAHNPKYLILRLENLHYLAAAGVRTLLLAKQKMGPGVCIYVLSPQEQVKDVLQRTGLQHDLIVHEEGNRWD